MLGFAAIFAVAFLWRTSFLLFSVLAVIALLLFVVQRDRGEALLFVLAGIWGLTAEWIVMFFGAWEYRIAHVLGAPYWLPILWGLAAVFLKRLYEEIDQKLREGERSKE